jgi:hypothetical protein
MAHVVARSGEPRLGSLVHLAIIYRCVKCILAHLAAGTFLQIRMWNKNLCPQIMGCETIITPFYAGIESQNGRVFAC